MATDWSFIPSLISTASGLIGVWLGSQLTWKRDARKENERVKTELTYMAILVTAHLNKLASECLAVAYDDGTIDGTPAGGNGEYHQTTVAPPKFDPLAIEVDWKVLPTPIMHSILNLPYLIERLDDRFAEIWRLDDPPEYADAFWGRQSDFAALGLKVTDLVRQLQTLASLPTDISLNADRSLDLNLQAQIERVTKERQDYMSYREVPASA